MKVGDLVQIDDPCAQMPCFCAAISIAAHLRAQSSRSHPKSYQGAPEIADIDIAWRQYGSDLYEQGEEDFLNGVEITSYDDVPEEYRDKHRFYLDGYFDAQKK